MELSNGIVLEIAEKYGFNLIGFAKAESLIEETERYAEWLAKGYHAEMTYLEKNFEKRKDVRTIFAEAKSVISLGMNYYIDDSFSENENAGKISRYAWGRDYHFTLWEKSDKLINELKKIDESFEAVSYVDTGPTSDKAWAVKAGLGWMGKHTNIINKKIGSWFFIATIITNKEFNYSSLIADSCGECRACVDACPTGALVSEYILDANKCISYQTIENKKEINENLKGKFDNWIFGCDACQDVCPWNKKFSRPATEEQFISGNINKEFTLEEINGISEKIFKERFKESPIKRTKLKGLKRNADFVLSK
jgi:epoxyqueuosine reductase